MDIAALLVIDMQKDLCYDIRRRAKVEDMIEPLLKAISAFAGISFPIFYPFFSLPEDDEQFERFGDRYCIEGTEGAEFIPELLPLNGIPIKKKKHSAFFETDLDDHLRTGRVSKVYLAGLQTQICIQTTAADASFRGYHTIVIRDCVVSTHDEQKELALDWIAKYVGDVATLDDVVVALSNKKNHG